METLAQRLVGALLNGAYQGLVLTALAGAFLLLLRRTNAATRHAVGLTTLAVLAALPVVHFLFPPQARDVAPAPPGTARARPLPSTSRPATAPAPIPSLATWAGISGIGPVETDPGEARGERELPSSLGIGVASTTGSVLEATEEPRVFIPALPSARDDAAAPIAAPAPSPALEDPLPGARTALSASSGSLIRADKAVRAPDVSRVMVPTRDSRIVKASPEATSGLVDRPHPGPSPARVRRATEGPGERSPLVRALQSLSAMRRHWQLPLPARAGLLLAAAWVIIALIRFSNLVRQWGQLQALKRRGSPPPAPVRRLFDAMHREIERCRATRLVMIPGAMTPMVAGFRRPVVLMPARLAERGANAQLEHVLRHELAHVHRRDDWANLFQQLVQAVLFFHPAVWWWSRRLTIDREIACDDHVLAATRTPRAYALLLTEFAGQMQHHRWSAALAGWTTRSQLNERITMILDTNRNSSTAVAKARVGTLTVATALAALIGLGAGPRLALAQSRTSGSSATPATAQPGELRAPSSATTGTLAWTPDTDAAPLELTGPATLSVQATSGPRPKPAPTPRPAVAPAASSFAPAPASGPALAPPAAPAAPIPAALASVPPVALISPTPAVLASVPPVAPAPLAISGPPGPLPAPVLAAAYPVPTSERKARAEQSLEERLDRLERMVESLLDREGPPRPKDAKRDESPSDLGLPGVHPQPSSNLSPHQWGGLKQEDWDLLKQREQEEIACNTEQAEKEAKRAVAEVDRLAKELSKRAGVEAEVLAKQAKQQAKNTHSKPAERQVIRQQLEIQRQHIEQQRNELDRQVARLEQQRDKLEEQVARLEEKLEAIDEQDSDASDAPEEPGKSNDKQ